MLKGNSFTQDDENERSERLALLSANIDDYSVELDLPAAKLAWAQGSSAAWEDARSLSTVEAGETDEAFEEADKAYKTAVKYYSSAKEYLLSIIWELEKPDDFIKDYGFGGPGPDCVRGLVAAINAWKRCHDRLLAEVPPDSRVVSDAIMTQLLTHRDIVDDLAIDARAERRERIDANAAKIALFDADSKLLSFLFSLCKLTWGDDDSRLGLLGFVPKSEIWTPGTPEPGTPIHPEAASFEANFLGQKTVELVYGAVVGAIKGTIRRRRTGNMNWIIIAQGLPMDDANRVPFRDTNVEQGEYEYEFICYNNAQEPSEASYSTVTVLEGIPK